ncbi:MAG: DUF1640 domain-containing protein, partial [Prochloron sp. SP5CPC1]|nr:DUF1640 domain-containing protein [Candidatus Paraprochloron terpiosi SP5CPC1]
MERKIDKLSEEVNQKVDKLGEEVNQKIDKLDNKVDNLSEEVHDLKLSVTKLEESTNTKFT